MEYFLGTILGFIIFTLIKGETFRIEITHRHEQVFKTTEELPEEEDDLGIELHPKAFEEAMDMIDTVFGGAERG